MPGLYKKTHRNSTNYARDEARTPERLLKGRPTAHWIILLNRDILKTVNVGDRLLPPSSSDREQSRCTSRSAQETAAQTLIKNYIDHNIFRINILEWNYSKYFLPLCT